MKAVIAAFAFAALLIAHAVPALALDAIVTNDTKHCAWITYYTSGSVLDPQWKIQASGFAPPSVDTKFKIGSNRQVKVRAEVTNGAACDTTHYRDVYDRRNSAYEHVTKADATLKTNGSSIWIDFK